MSVTNVRPSKCRRSLNTAKLGLDERATRACLGYSEEKVCKFIDLNLTLSSDSTVFQWQRESLRLEMMSYAVTN